MAKPRRRYPSDERPYFRVLDSVLDDPQLNALDLADQALYFRLLATLNRQGSRDGWGRLDRFSACALAKMERWPYALQPYLTLASLGLVSLRCGCGEPRVSLRCACGTSSALILYLIPKWSKIQGFAPAQFQQDSSQTPPLRGEESRGEERREEKSEEAPAEPDAAPADPLEGHRALLNLLGPFEAKPPPEADEREAWLTQNLVRLIEDAESKVPDGASARQRKSKLKSLTIGWWQNYLRGERGFKGITEQRASAKRRAEALAKYGPAYDREIAENGPIN